MILGFPIVKHRLSFMCSNGIRGGLNLLAHYHFSASLFFLTLYDKLTQILVAISLDFVIIWLKMFKLVLTLSVV